MISIHAIASYIPEGFESNLDKLEKFAIDRAFIDDKIGVERVARRAEGEETSDMCVRAFEALREKVVDIVEDVDFLMVVTQNPDGHGLPQVSAIVHDKLGLSENCAAFDLALACSGYVYGLSVAKSFMEANGLKTGLLFTCDPYSGIIDPDDKNTALLFGDAATVTFLSQQRPGQAAFLPTRFHFTTHGNHANDVHNRSGAFYMNGQAVYMFAMRTVPGHVGRVLEQPGLALNDIDLFIFHQGSKFIVDSLADRMGVSRNRVPVDIRHHGNTVSSSIPLMFERHINRPDINRVVLNGFGVGLSVGSCLLERIDTQ